MTKPTGNPRGRPPFEFSKHHLKTIERLATIGTPNEQIAFTIGCSHDTLERHLKEGDPVFACISKGRSKFDTALRSNLARMALSDKHPGVAIFMAKVRLRMKEPKQEMELSGPNGNPIASTFNFSDEVRQYLEERARDYIRRKNGLSAR